MDERGRVSGRGREEREAGWEKEATVTKIQTGL